MPDHVATDESLVLAAGRGDLAAFAEPVNRHQVWAWSIAYRFLGDVQGAEDVVQDAFLRMLRAALDRLPPNQRMAVVLRYDEGLDYRRIAEALHISSKAVERLLARARSSLRGRLQI